MLIHVLEPIFLKIPQNKQKANYILTIYLLDVLEIKQTNQLLNVQFSFLGTATPETRRGELKSYKVIVEFIDRHTRFYYAVGDSYETDNTKRAEELQKGGFLEKTQVEEKSEAAKPLTPPNQ